MAHLQQGRRVLRKTLPQADLADILHDMDSSERDATELITAAADESGTVSKMTENVATLSVHRQSVNGIKLVESLVALTFQEVCTRYGKTPNSLRMRSIVWPDNKGKSRTYYWMEDEGRREKYRI